jgi:uncharacterized membrane protein YphA (DoxX/SURF4 family)
MNTSSTAGYASMRGVKQARPLTQLTGVMIIVGGLGVILGVYIDLAALLLVFFTLPTAFLVHHFWTDEDMLKTVEMSMFLKNLSITGGALIVFASAVNGADLGPMLTGPLFG